MDEIEVLQEENRKLRLRIMELETDLENEVQIRQEIQENAKNLLAAEGISQCEEPTCVKSLHEQIEKLTDRAKALKIISDLQSQIIDKQFIIKQGEEIATLKATTDSVPPQPQENEPDNSPVYDDTWANDDSVHEPHHSSAGSEHAVDTSSYVDPNDSVNVIDELGSTITTHDYETPRQKYKRGFTHVFYNTATERPPAETYSILNLHSNDRERVTRFTSVLERLKYMPEQVDTLIIADSNGHKIKGSQLDPDKRTWILSTGGLCLVSAVHGLQVLSESYPNIQKIIYMIGTNDILHKQQHIQGERGPYLKALRDVTVKVFPNGRMSLILPFVGGKIPKSEITNLKEEIKSKIPDCEPYHPPTMKGMFSDNVHLNSTGMAQFTRFLQDYMIPRRPVNFSSRSGRQSAASTYAESLNLHIESPPSHSDPVQSLSSTPLDSNWPPVNPRHRSMRAPLEPPVDPHFVEHITQRVVRELLKQNIRLNNYY